MIKNIFPQDTRLVELLSSLSLILMGISLWIAPYDQEIIQYNTHKFWSIITLIFGGFQLLSMIFSEDLPLIRTITAWLIGMFFVWIGSSYILIYGSLVSYVVVMLGFGNWYALVLNINFMRKEWIS